MLKIKNLSKHYGELQVVDNFNIHINKGEFVTILGKSGCGKTTLLRIIAGLEEPTTGKILLEGKKPSEFNRKIGLMFQEDTCFEWLTVRDNIKFPLTVNSKNKSELNNISEKILREMELYEYREYYPKQLSGGMKQRVSLGRILSFNPKIMLLDEPFGALDNYTRNTMQDLILNIWKNRKTTILFVTHNVEEAIYLGNKIVICSDKPMRVKKIIKLYKNKTAGQEVKISAKFVSLRKNISSLFDKNFL